MWTTATTIAETGAISFNFFINSTSHSDLASTGSQWGPWTNTPQLYSLSSRRMSGTLELRRLMSLRKWLHLHYVCVEQIQSNGLILLIPSYWRTRSQSDISSSWWKKLAHSITKLAPNERVYQLSQRESGCQPLLLRPRNWLISVIEVLVNLKVWRSKNYESSNSTSVESR